MILQGKAHKFWRDVDTDVIIPARYLNVSDPVELAKHVMEGLDRDFARKVKEGDMIVAGKNFGCGSSREHAPLAIKASGISCVIAKSFARIFYRNSINIGLPILECAEAVDGIKEGDALRVDLGTGAIINVSTGKSFQSQPFPEFMQQIMERGGLINYVREKIRKAKADD